MNNIIVFTPEEADGCSWYRAFGVLGHLPNVQLHKANTVTWATFAGMDIAFFQRPYNKKHLTVMQLAKSMGCKVWVDYDDLLMHVPESNPAYDAYKFFKTPYLFLCAADVVTVSTKQLALELRTHTEDDKIKVIPNAYNDYVLSTEFERGYNRTTIMWRGTKSHQGDLHKFADQLNVTFSNHNDPFLFVGYDPWMLNKLKNVYYHEAIGIPNYFNYLVDEAPGYLIVPLEDNAFNRCKSNIAQLEVARCGTTVIGPSWLEWNRDLTHIVHYDHYKDLSMAIKQAKEERAELSDDDLRAKWDVGLDRIRLSKVNELRTEVIDGLVR